MPIPSAGEAKAGAKKVLDAFFPALCFDVLAGGVVCVLGLVFVRPLASLLGAGETLAPLSVQYLRGIMLCAPAVVSLGAPMQFVQLDGSARLSLPAVAAMTVSDVALDLLAVALDGDTFVMAGTAVRWMALSLPLRFVNLLLAQYYQSTGRTTRSVLLSLSEVLAAPVLLAAALMRALGVAGIWLAFPAAELLTLLLFLASLPAGRGRGSLQNAG